MTGKRGEKGRKESRGKERRGMTDRFFRKARGRGRGGGERGKKEWEKGEGEEEKTRKTRV